MADSGHWDGAADSIEDPEEKRVICCALDSYLQYAKVAHFNVTHLRRQSFYALPQAQWQMLAKPPFNFLDTLEKTDDAIDSNADLARNIAKNGIESFGLAAAPPPPQSPSDLSRDANTTTPSTTNGRTDGPEPTMPREWIGVAKHGDIDKARSTLRQFYRDWSAEGAVERNACYGPVMRAVKAQDEFRKQQDETSASSSSSNEPLNILVPGAGLGRLVFELCLAGYSAEGNEISYHQLLASSYILNCTSKPGAHTIYPWVHTFSNHLTRENHLRGYEIPDVHPATEIQKAGDKVGSMSMSAADFLCLYSDNDHTDAYDVVAAVFFLDTAPNLIRYLETIYHCLRPGGILVNIGPLLWHFENNAPGNHGHDDDGDGEHDYNNSSGIADPGSFELADDEVMALVERIGFTIESRETGLTAPYIQDAESMLQTVYKASTWVARKPLDGSAMSVEM